MFIASQAFKHKHLSQSHLSVAASLSCSCLPGPRWTDKVSPHRVRRSDWPVPSSPALLRVSVQASVLTSCWARTKDELEAIPKFSPCQLCTSSGEGLSLELHPRSTPSDEVYSSGLTGMPDPACSTSMGEGQTATTDDQPPVIVSRAHRPYFMAEYAAGSGEYLKAFVVDENQAQVKLRFPACKETKNKDEVVWVSRCSSTIWRRSIAKDAWAKVANGEGAWRPKKRKGTGGRPSRKKSAKLEDGTRHMPTAEQAQDLSPGCLEGSAECPDRGETNMATSQEVIVLHDLPSDPLAAWFYKNDEGSVEVNLLGTQHMGNNTGCEAAILFEKARGTGKKPHANGPTLDRDDSAMEEAWSQSLQSKSVSRPSIIKPSAVQSSHATLSAVPAKVVKAYNC